MKKNAKVNKVINQAKESFKLFEALEKEAISKARTLVKIPNASDRKRITSAKILASLKKMGVATQEELDSLLSRIEKLEAMFANQEK